MSDFGSIDDLAGGNSSDHDDKIQKSENISVASEETEKEFQNKMSELQQKEKEREAKRLAKSIGYPYLDLTDFPVSQEALKLMTEEQVKEYDAVPFYYNSTDKELRIGALKPDSDKIQKLKQKKSEEIDVNVKLYTISKRSLKYTLDLYKNMPTVEDVRKEVKIDTQELEKVQSDIEDFSSLKGLLEGVSETSRAVSYILGAGIKLDASDIHIEAEKESVQVRLRIDGILHDAATISRNLYEKVVSRIKLVASLKLNITDEPQDGRFTITVGGSEVDVRVSTIPTVHGESVVMRLLKQDREGLSLSDLGLHKKSFKLLKKEIERPNGMVITTGPTGSGKTTTLYSIMNLLNKPEVKIITLENPVEYKMDGINQSEVGSEEGDYSFAEGLESMLRQDPDIAMVGEIRNLNTAETAVQAALTGHLILSTLHTNSGAGAIPRFLSMGVKPFLLAPALNCVIGQRLVRVLCDNCKKEIELESDTEKKVKEQIESMPEDLKKEAKGYDWKFYGPGGCDKCNDIGYEGRTGIYEIFVIDSEFEDMILEGNVAEHKIEEKAIEKGMMTMVQDGVLKALQGMTSISEVYRVIE